MDTRRSDRFLLPGALVLLLGSMAIFVNDAVSTDGTTLIEVGRDSGGTGAAARDGPARNVGDILQSAHTTEISPDNGTASGSKGPILDLVRIDPSGNAVVSGTAPIGSTVVIRVDGAEIGTAPVGSGGSFASLLEIDILAKQQLLSVEAVDVTGRVTPAQDAIVVASALPNAPMPNEPPRIRTRPVASSGRAGEAFGSDHDRGDRGALLDPPVRSSVLGIDDAFDTGIATPSRASSEIGGHRTELDPGERTVAGEEDALIRADLASAGVYPEGDVIFSGVLQADRYIIGPSNRSRTAGPGLPDRSVVAGDATVSPSTAASPLVGTPPAIDTAAAAQGSSRGEPAAKELANPTEAVPAQGAIVARDGRDLPEETARERAPRLFRVGPDGVAAIETDSALSADAVQALGIDAITYDSRGDVELTGQAGADATLRVYLDDAPVTDVQSGADGRWSSPLPGVRAGLYRLRIDALAPDGTVTSRVETPFQRTAPEIAAAARREGATAITVQPGFTLWAIAEGYFGSGVRYVQIFDANRGLIRDPDLIFPGQVFALPGSALD